MVQGELGGAQEKAPWGVKVMLEDGQVGRVKAVLTENQGGAQ